MNIRLGLSLLMLATLSACGGATAKPAAMEPPGTANWRAMATTADRLRLRDWRKAWSEALAKARLHNSAAIAAEGALFDFDHALTGAIPPAGDYRCRVFKLGASGTAMQEFTRYPDFECRVGQEGDVSSFYKLSGAQRPAG